MATRKKSSTIARSRQPVATARSKRVSPQARRSPPKWSARVTARSDALDLQPGVFRQRSALKIAHSLKKSAEASGRRKASPFRSAMSMLNFEINRAGKGLAPARRLVLERAKGELRKAFGKPAS